MKKETKKRTTKAAASNPTDRKQRLSERRAALDAELRELDAEIETAPDGDERGRMRHQAIVMRQHLEILGARIAAL